MSRPAMTMRPLLGDVALALDEGLADAGDSGDEGDVLVDFGERREFVTSWPSMMMRASSELSGSGSFTSHIDGGGELGEGVRVVDVEAAVEGGPGDGAVHDAGVQEAVAEAVGEQAADGALA